MSDTDYQFTILTESRTVSHKMRMFVFRIKQRIKFLLSYVIKNSPWKEQPIPKYSGHYAVTRSIVQGLETLGASFNYNPRKEKDIASIVFVPGNSALLSYVLGLKKTGKIKKIIAGPNLAVMPSEITAIPDSTAIDIYLQPSDWVINLWKSIDPQFPIPLKTWYAGVDTTVWKPSSEQRNNKTVLFYKKHVPNDFYLQCREIFEQHGFAIEVIAYGTYTADQYLAALQRNSVVVHLTESESQGISLAEAWATNTPTIVWNPQVLTHETGIYTESSSAPYLTKQTGVFFTTIDELAGIVSSWQPECYAPRAWCIQHMSDRVSAEKLLRIIDTIM